MTPVTYHDGIPHATVPDEETARREALLALVIYGSTLDRAAAELEKAIGTHESDIFVARRRLALTRSRICDVDAALASFG